MHWTATIVSALCWGLASPTPAGIGWVILGAVVLRQSIVGSPGVDAARGLLFGAIFYGIQLAWVPGAWATYGASGGVWVYLALLAAQAWPVAAVHGAASVAMRRGWRAGAALSLAWAAGALFCEYVQPLPAPPSVLLAGAPVLCVPMAWGGHALATGLLLWTAAHPTQVRGLAVAAVWMATMAWPSIFPGSPHAVSVGLIQLNVDAFDTRRADTAEDRTLRLLEGMEGLSAADIQFVVTPEGAWPHDPGQPGSLAHEKLTFAFRSLPPVVLGVRARDGGTLPYNRLLALEAGTEVGRFDKRILVPGTERAAFGREQAMRAGDTPRTLTLGAYRLGPLICYEDLHPVALREAVDQRAQLLITATQDGWLPDAGRAWHEAYARLAAVQTGRPIVRAAMDGPSAVFDRWGRIVRRIARGPGDPQAAAVRVPLASGWGSGAHRSRGLAVLAFCVLMFGPETWRKRPWARPDAT